MLLFLFRDIIIVCLSSKMYRIQIWYFCTCLRTSGSRCSAKHHWSRTRFWTSLTVSMASPGATTGWAGASITIGSALSISGSPGCGTSSPSWFFSQWTEWSIKYSQQWICVAETLIYNAFKYITEVNKMYSFGSHLDTWTLLMNGTCSNQIMLSEPHIGYMTPFNLHKGKGERERDGQVRVSTLATVLHNMKSKPIPYSTKAC